MNPPPQLLVCIAILAVLVVLNIVIARNNHARIRQHIQRLGGCVKIIELSCQFGMWKSPPYRVFTPTNPARFITHIAEQVS